jgi:hypothetical protein
MMKGKSSFLWRSKVLVYSKTIQILVARDIWNKAMSKSGDKAM